jgi:ubiquinone/menaquinone biosynthesis C-methylase UbiE
MDFYTSIADFYDEIFPYNDVQRQFVKSFGIHGDGSAILDVGCGTGSLALNLAGIFKTVVGIDPDREMLKLANLKALGFKAERRCNLEELGSWVFMEKGMLDLSDVFAPESFDAIICFGNTLVHLHAHEDIGEFLEQAEGVLKPGGMMMIQIINYDRIIDKQMDGLPTIENEKIRFERKYIIERDPEIIDFHTTLTVLDSGDIIRNQVPLLALRPGKLREMMINAGLSGLEEFGSFKKTPFTSESQPYIVIGRK